MAKDKKNMIRVEIIKIFKCKVILSGIKKFKFLDWIIKIPGKRTKSIFIILLPITFPIPIDPFFLTYEITTVASSGRDVPIASIVYQLLFDLIQMK